MVSGIKLQLMNETRENQRVSDYVWTSSSRLLSILFGKTLSDSFIITWDCPNFDECYLCIYKARIADVSKMTAHLALSRDKNAIERKISLFYAIERKIFSTLSNEEIFSPKMPTK